MAQSRVLGGRSAASEKNKVIHVATIGPRRTSSAIVWGDEVVRPTSSEQMGRGRLIDAGKRGRPTAHQQGLDGALEAKGGGDDESNGINMVLMVKSRILVPFIYLIFNVCYWGVAFKYVVFFFLYQVDLFVLQSVVGICCMKLF